MSNETAAIRTVELEELPPREPTRLTRVKGYLARNGALLITSSALPSRQDFNVLVLWKLSPLSGLPLSSASIISTGSSVFRNNFPGFKDNVAPLNGTIPVDVTFKVAEWVPFSPALCNAAPIGSLYCYEGTEYGMVVAPIQEGREGYRSIVYFNSLDHESDVDEVRRNHTRFQLGVGLQILVKGGEIPLPVTVAAPAPAPTQDDAPAAAQAPSIGPVMERVIENAAGEFMAAMGLPDINWPFPAAHPPDPVPAPVPGENIIVDRPRRRR